MDLSRFTYNDNSKWLWASNWMIVLTVGIKADYWADHVNVNCFLCQAADGTYKLETRYTDGRVKGEATSGHLTADINMFTLKVNTDTSTLMVTWERQATVLRLVEDLSHKLPAWNFHLLWWRRLRPSTRLSSSLRGQRPPGRARLRSSTAGGRWWRKWGGWRPLRLRGGSLTSPPRDRRVWPPGRRDSDSWSTRDRNSSSSSGDSPAKWGSSQGQSRSRRSSWRSNEIHISGRSAASQADIRKASGPWSDQQRLQWPAMSRIPSSATSTWPAGPTPTTTEPEHVATRALCLYMFS